MKFVTNSISTKTRNVPTLSEMFKAAQTRAALNKSASVKQPVVKTASAAGAVEEIEIELKVAGGNLANFGDKKAEPFGKKDKKEDKDEKKPEAKKDKEDKDCPCDKEADAVLVTVKVAEEGKSDEAESSGQLEVEPLHQKGESTGEKPGSLDTNKDGKGGSKGGAKADKDGEGKSSGQPEAEAKLVNHPKVDKDASNKAGFKKIAELTTEEKDFLRGVWSNFWPKAFIDAILKPQ